MGDADLLRIKLTNPTQPCPGPVPDWRVITGSSSQNSPGGRRWTLNFFFALTPTEGNGLFALQMVHDGRRNAKYVPRTWHVQLDRIRIHFPRA